MVQFVAVVTAFILMAGFMLQIHHIQTSDLGFRRDHLLIVDALTDKNVTPAQREAFMNAARALPAVRSASYSDTEPGLNSAWASANIARPGRSDDPLHTPALLTQSVGPDYFSMLGTRLLAGRLFDPQRAEDEMTDGPEDASGVINVVISRGAVHALGFSSPTAAIGQTATAAGPVVHGHIRIIGVVEDVRFGSPEDPVQPALYVLRLRPDYAAGMVRYQGVSEPAMRQILTRVWHQIDPDVPVGAISLTEKLDDYYRPERNRSHLFTIGTGIAALIGCIGLYGMAAFNAGRRVREIGMRKVLGASRGQMVRLLLTQFLRPVALASLIAWPLAWIALQRWLAQFDDVIAMPLWLFPSASGVSLLIALVAVLGVALAAASTEPGKALRHD